MARLRERVAGEHPALGHDMSHCARLTLERRCAKRRRLALPDAAYEAFFAERNGWVLPRRHRWLERISVRVRSRR